MIANEPLHAYMHWGYMLGTWYDGLKCTSHVLYHYRVAFFIDPPHHQYWKEPWLVADQSLWSLRFPIKESFWSSVSCFHFQYWKWEVSNKNYVADSDLGPGWFYTLSRTFLRTHFSCASQNRSSRISVLLHLHSGQIKKWQKFGVLVLRVGLWFNWLIAMAMQVWLENTQTREGKFAKKIRTKRRSKLR